MNTVNVIQLAYDLCAIASTTGNEKAVCDYVENLLKTLNFYVQTQKVDENGRKNIFATTLQKPNFKVLFTTHLDTVPLHIAPEIDETNGMLKGRGVCDAKGIAAAMIVAANKLKQQNVNVGLLFVVGEETHSDGAKLAAKWLSSTKYVVHGEPTDLALATAMKGSIVFSLQSKGHGGHSAYPEGKTSAIHQLTYDIQRLLTYKWPIDNDLGTTTLNIGEISGGPAPNVIATYASARGIFRTNFQHEGTLKTLKDLLNSQTEMKILSNSPPQRLTDIPQLQVPRCIVSFGSDIAHLRHLGQPILIGPGSIHDAHTDHEKILIADLHKAVDIYEFLAKLN